MSVLLLRLAAPMQSWGSSSKFNYRLTEKEPTKSGIIGLLACALGIKREEPIDELKGLKFGVRVDQIGELNSDFQMVHEETNSKNASSWVTRRYYLFDAVYMVALEGPLEMLQKLEYALSHPRFPLYLGRRSCPPTGKLVLGIKELTLTEALKQEPWLASKWYQKRFRKREYYFLEIVRDAEDDESIYSLRDNPESFNPIYKRYNFRNVVREKLDISNWFKTMESESKTAMSTEHDAMELLEVENVSNEN